MGTKNPCAADYTKADRTQNVRYQSARFSAVPRTAPGTRGQKGLPGRSYGIMDAWHPNRNVLAVPA